MLFSGTALAMGWGTAAILGAGIGAAAYGAAGGFSKKEEAIDSRVQAAAVPGTGQITEEEAQTTAKKRAYRSGILFTSPLGREERAPTATAKLR